MSAARRTRLADAGTYLAYGVICLFFAGPLLWLVSLSIRTAAEIYRQRHPHLARRTRRSRTTPRRSATRSFRPTSGTG